METVSLTINEKKIVTEKGKRVLWAALENGIFIPHLCAIEENPLPFGSCRLCFVEIEGKKEPVASCTEEVTDGMIVDTRTESVLRLVRMAFKLIMSRHPIICRECRLIRSVPFKTSPVRWGLNSNLRGCPKYSLTYR